MQRTSRDACGSPPETTADHARGTPDADPLWTPSAHSIRVLYRDRFDRMWVGTDGDGLFLYDHERVSHFRRADGLGGNQIRSLYCDRQRRALDRHAWSWVTRYAGGKFTTYTTRDGLPNDSVTAITEDEDGALYFATRGGLCRRKDGRFHAYRKEDGLHSDILSGMVDDLQGNFWLASADGIYSVSQKDLREHAAGTIKTLHVRRLWGQRRHADDHLHGRPSTDGIADARRPLAVRHDEGSGPRRSLQAADESRAAAGSHRTGAN